MDRSWQRTPGARAMLPLPVGQQQCRALPAHGGRPHGQLKGKAPGDHLNRTARAAVYPKALTRALIRDFQRIITRNNFQDIIPAEIDWSCPTCKFGSKTDLPHTRVPGKCKRAPKKKLEEIEPLDGFEDPSTSSADPDGSAAESHPSIPAETPTETITEVSPKVKEDGDMVVDEDHLAETQITINAQLDIPEINVPDPASMRLAIKLEDTGAARQLKRLCIRTAGDVLTKMKSDKQFLLSLTLLQL